MARRKKFCLIFSSDPPAIDVVREDFVIGNVAELLENLGREPDNCHCTFRWEKSKDTFETIPGRVLMIGMVVNDLYFVSIICVGYVIFYLSQCQRSLPSDVGIAHVMSCCNFCVLCLFLIFKG